VGTSENAATENSRGMGSIHLLTLCTGNAARSVMAAYSLQTLAQMQGLTLKVTSAGTHAIDGQPISRRTRAAILGIEELSTASLGHHRSRQLRESDLHGVDLVIAMEADHVRYVRRVHPEFAAKTATFTRLVEELPGGSSPLSARVGALGLGAVSLETEVDVLDPAGCDDETYHACAREVMGLCQELIVRL